MIIQAELKCKQTGCEADPCAVDKVMQGASVMGYLLLGTICFFNVTVRLAFPAIQAGIDGIFPQLLSFLTVCGFYVYLRKGGKFLRMMLYCIAVTIVLSVLGVV